MNNTRKHISDSSKDKTFDPTGTAFPSNVTNVQDALALAGPIRSATETLQGSIRIATQAQVDAGTDDFTAVTPKKLASRLSRPQATTTVLGVIRIATQTESRAGTNADAAIVPSTLNDYLSFRIATQTVSGTIKISTTAAASAGTDDTTAMTPLKVKQAIAAATAQIPSYSTATESINGLVRLATAGQVQQGTLRDGYAISPYALAQLTSNDTRRGLSKAATQAEVNTGTDDSVYVSAKGFKTFLASTVNIGTVKLTNTVGTAGAGLALSANANVLSLSGGTITGTLNVVGTLQQNGSPIFVETDIDKYVPIGTIITWTSPSLPSPNWQWYKGQKSLPVAVGSGTFYYNNRTTQVDLHNWLDPGDDFTDINKFTLLITPEAPHEAWSIVRATESFNINIFNRSGTSRVGYYGNVSWVVYRNGVLSDAQIKRYQ